MGFSNKERKVLYIGFAVMIVGFTAATLMPARAPLPEQQNVPVAEDHQPVTFVRHFKPVQAPQVEEPMNSNVNVAPVTEQALNALGYTAQQTARIQVTVQNSKK